MKPDLIIKKAIKPMSFYIYVYIFIFIIILLTTYVLYYKYNNRLPKNLITLNDIFEESN